MQAAGGSAVNTNIGRVLLGVFCALAIGVYIFVAQAMKEEIKALDEKITKITKEIEVLEEAREKNEPSQQKMKPGYREYTH